MKITNLLTSFIVLFTSVCLLHYSNRSRFKEKPVKKLFVSFMFLETLLILLTIFHAIRLDTVAFLYEALCSTILMVQIWRIQSILIFFKNPKNINTFS